MFACLDSKTCSYTPGSCRGCRAKWREDGCLFVSSYTPIEPSKSNRDLDNDDAKRRKRKAEKRALGKTEHGHPLPETCWNCRGLKFDGIRYICDQNLLDEALTEHQAKQARQARECRDFQLRLTEGIESA